MLITYFWENWRYSNAPEGQAPFEKIVGLSKFGFAGSFVMGMYDTIILSQTTGLWQTANCFAFWMVPITAMCATFASVAYTTTKIRGKDGYFNYILASLATGAVCYHWRKKGPFAYHFTVLLCGAATVRKHSDLTGWKPFPLDVDMRRRFTTLPDFTLIKDPRGSRPWEH